MPFALVLVPTRELAAQVVGEFEKLSYALPVKTIAVYGGSSMKSQLVALKQGVDVVVGTPGRVLDHLGRGTLNVSQLEIVVLDEADRMLDIGFRPDIEKILRKCPQDRQTLLLSATLPPTILRLAQRYMKDPVTLNFSQNDIAVETIEQHYFTVDHERKYDLLVHLLRREKPTQAIVFCRTKRRTQWLHIDLNKQFDSVGCMHGDLAQKQRDRMMAKFRQGGIKILVATDVVGRGIDVTGISHIINYDMPSDSDDYVHRVGRTGRMGREGVAFTFVTPDEGAELTKIEMRIDRQLKCDQIEGFETVAPKVTPEKDPDAPTPPAPIGRPTKRYRRGL
jgi:ATP-dependent RNA helicase DeaD